MHVASPATTQCQARYVPRHVTASPTEQEACTCLHRRRRERWVGIVVETRGALRYRCGRSIGLLETGREAG